MEDQLQGSELRRVLEPYRREFILYIDTAGRILGGDGALGNAIGYADGEQQGTHIAEHIHPDDLTRVLEVVKWARTTEPPFSQRLLTRARHKDGRWIPFSSEVISAEPPLRGVIVRTRPLDADDPEFVQDDARFASLADVVPMGILASDVRGFVVFANEPASQLLGCSAEKLHGMGWERNILGDGRELVHEASERVLAGSQRERVLCEIERFGEARWMNVTFVRLGTASSVSGWLATLEDVTERQRATAELAHKATHDPLTGLPNRLLLEDRIGQAMARMRRTGSTITALFMDLDHFKDVNDEFGHSVGDDVLVEASIRLHANLRQGDTLARLGGDEFVAICEGLEDQEVIALIERLRSSVGEAMQLAPDRADHHQGISIGSRTVSAREAATVADLLASADMSMYEDKQQRRLAEGAGGD